MSFLLVMNHHSLPYDSPETADSAVHEFLKICIKANNLGFTTILVDERIDKDWFRLELAREYFWQDWYNKNKGNENREAIRAFRSIQTKQPFFSADDVDSGIDLFEVLHNGESSYSALRAAVWHVSPITSFPTCTPWDCTPIPVQINQCDYNGEIVTCDFDITNYYSLNTLAKDEVVLLQKRNAVISSGKELFASKTAYYPNLIFCGKADEQLLCWSYSAAILEQVKESFSTLNRFCELWQDGHFDNYTDANLLQIGLNHQVSGESETVHKNPALRSLREFWLPTGRKAIFEKHIKLTNGFRIHFYPDPSIRKIYIGYVGLHLKLI